MGRGDQLNEQKIGEKVFERKAGYDSGEDNIVRSNASRLRQRIETYFLHEGQNEPLRLSLPRGAYVPEFMSIAAPYEEPSGSAAPQGNAASISAEMESRDSVKTRARNVNPILAGALAVMTVIAAWQWNAHRVLVESTQSSSPVMHALWHELFPPGKRTLIVPADSSLVLYENLTGTTVSLQSYMDKKYLAQESDTPAQASDDVAKRIGHRRLTSIADIEFTSQLLRIPEAVAARPEMRFARDLQVVDLKESNGILLGAQESNPWLSMFESRRNFILSDNQQTRAFTVLNRSPRAGELPAYHSDQQDPRHLAYGIVALLPNLGGSGNILIVEGTSIAGTEAAVDFLTGTTTQIESILAPAYRQYGRIPPFEVLIETTNLNGTAPQSHIVAVRVTP